MVDIDVWKNIDALIFEGITADRLVRKNVITLVTARKLFNSLTSFIPALCMISFCFCDEDRRGLGVATVILLLMSSGNVYADGLRRYLTLLRR